MDTMEKKYPIYKQDQRVLTVTRGEKIKNDLIEKRIHDLLYKDKLLNALLQKIKSSTGNYSGTFYSNYFKVDQSIRLIELGFFGPCQVEDAKYNVHIEIFEKLPKSKKVYPTVYSGKKISKTFETISVKKDANFYIELCNGGVEIKPGVWYLIQFMLDGPNTYKCEGTVTTARVDVGDTSVNFEFDAGSMQMPYMRFII